MRLTTSFSSTILLGQVLFLTGLLFYKLAKDGREVSLVLVFAASASALFFGWATKFSRENRIRVCLVSILSRIVLLAIDVFLMAVPLQLAREKKSSLLTSYLKDGYSQNLVGQQALLDQLSKQYCDSEETKLKSPQAAHQPATRPDGPFDRFRGAQIGRVMRLLHLRSWLTARLVRGRRSRGWRRISQRGELGPVSTSD